MKIGLTTKKYERAVFIVDKYGSDEKSMNRIDWR